MDERTAHETLLGASGRADEAAFEELVVRYQEDVATLANRLLGWPGEVEDVTQEVFLAAYLNLKRFRGQCHLRTWLYTITVNTCRSHARKQWVRQRFLRRLTSRESHDHHPADRDAELHEILSCVLRKLPVRYREPVVLYYLEELSVERIGEILRLAPNTVHVRLNRARRQLKEKLNMRGIEA